MFPVEPLPPEPPEPEVKRLPLLLAEHDMAPAPVAEERPRRRTIRSELRMWNLVSNGRSNSRPCSTRDRGCHSNGIRGLLLAANDFRRASACASAPRAREPFDDVGRHRRGL